MQKPSSILPLNSWKPKGQENFIIAGPCGAETEQQVMQTAAGIAALNKVSVFRSGIWKPRTRPNSFEGVGTVGLQWLQQVKKEYGLLTTVEVANAHHTEEALKYGVDILWIGARTTVNPFSVQEIADVLKGVDVPVMIKNPVHADLQLWIGAIERIAQAGIDKIIAIHRGFHTGQKSKFRNVPLWEIPIELKTIFPELPVICDPSHISGRRDLIKDVAQKAIDLGMDGLMIESHNNPQQALSDAQQQLVPADLGVLLRELNFRKTSSQNQEFINELQNFRNIIDEIDEELIRVLKKRSDIITRIGEYKKEHHVTIFQLERWKEILRTRAESAAQKGFPPEFTEKLCQLLHEESIRMQTEIMNKK
ncbi:MAG: chorismate mutase [Bacteroidia bacterium]